MVYREVKIITDFLDSHNIVYKKLDASIQWRKQYKRHFP